MHLGCSVIYIYKKAQLTPGKRATAVCVCRLVFAISPLFQRPLAEERLAISTHSIHCWKVHLVGYNSVADNTSLPSFVYLLLPPKYDKCGEIPIEFDLKAVQGHPRSWTLVSMESQYVTSYWSLIVTLAVSATVFEIFTLKDRKMLILLAPPLFDAPARETP